MIKLEIPTIEPLEAYTDAQRINRADNLNRIRTAVGENQDLNFSDNYWKQFATILYQRYQRGKCAYCERVIVDEIDDRLEHYRPKAKITTPDDDDLEIKPGYWWLCYDWRNYVVSCERCNNKKKNHFPILDEQHRAQAEEVLQDDGRLGREKPILINPRFQNPEEYFSYDIELYSVAGQVRIIPTNKEDNDNKAEIARKNIDILDLDKRDGIREERATVYKQLRMHLNNCTKAYEAKERFIADPDESAERVEASNRQYQNAKSNIILFLEVTPHLGMCRWYMNAHAQDYQPIIPEFYA